MADPTTFDLLICGASARAASQSAVRAGFRPLAADLFADTDLRQIAAVERIDDYPQGFLPFRRQHAEVPLILLGGLENHPDLWQELQESGPFYGWRHEDILRARDPWQLADLWRLNDIPYPAVRSNPPDDHRTWLVKPRRSAAGHGIRHWNRLEFQQRTESKIAPSVPNSERRDLDEDVYYQLRIEGEPCSGVFLVTGTDCFFLGSSQMIVGAPWTGCDPTEGPFRYCGSVEKSYSESEWQQWSRLGHIFGKLGIGRGLFGIDAIWDGSTLWPIEVNPRYTASMELFERGESSPSLIQHHVRACGSNRYVPKNLSPRLLESQEIRSYSGKVILYARSRVQFSCFRFPSGRLGQETELADIPKTGDWIESGHPICTLLVTGNGPEAVRQRLEQSAAQFWELLSQIQDGLTRHASPERHEPPS